MPDAPLRVAQLSDLHISTSAGGYQWRNTTESFAAVAEHVMEDPPDMLVITGDIADQGRPEEYEQVGLALAGFDRPVYCLPGNHDRTDAFHAHLPRPGVLAQPAMRVGDWQFLFGDSNLGGRTLEPQHGWVDTPDRIHDANGSLTDNEYTRLESQLTVPGAEHSMLWLHHPPGSSRFFEEPAYDEQIRGLLEGTTVRAVAAGHAHTGITVEIGGIPSHLCPSTGLSVDFEAMTVMPPGYRRYEFWPDGTINTEVVWVEDERWSKRHRFPPVVAEYLAGRATSEDVQASLGVSG